MNEIANDIEYLMEILGINTREVGRLVGLDKRTIERWRGGGQEASIKGGIIAAVLAKHLRGKDTYETQALKELVKLALFAHEACFTLIDYLVDSYIQGFAVKKRNEESR